MSCWTSDTTSVDVENIENLPPLSKKELKIFRMIKHRFKQRSIFNKSTPSPKSSPESCMSSPKRNIGGDKKTMSSVSSNSSPGSATLPSITPPSSSRTSSTPYRRKPFQDTMNSQLQFQAQQGVMESTGNKLRKGELGTQFQTVDEVQDMIRHLQKIEEDMLKNGPRGIGNKSWCSSFEDLSLLEDKELQIDENETEWLVKVPGAKKIRAKDLESDESFIDSGLLNVRYGLINLIKSSLIEEKNSKFKSSPSLSMTSNHHTYKRSPPVPPYRRSPPRFESEPPLQNAETTHGLSKHLEESSPPKTTFNTFNFLSPARPSTIADSVRDRDPDLNFLYASTPAKQIDSRTYTRPKKNRMPLDAYYSARDIPISPIRGTANIAESIDPPPDPVDSDPLSTAVNMNETYVAGDDAEPPKESPDFSPPRRVTRNLSYVIRRDSDSPNNNSPVHASENNENASAELNNTFVRSREDVYSPSPTGSSNSIHTSSMEELHNMARLQEQTLRMSSSPKVLTRTDTHIVRTAEPQSYRTMPKVPLESQIPGQSKRIQSRIPAPGLGSRIRPPLNGTRRPITSGGIRRAPDWQDDGAY